jgi:Glycosyltransferase family 92
MACLVTAYVFIVISVTQIHFFQQSNQEKEHHSSSNNTEASNVLNSEMQALKEKVASGQAVESKQQQQQEQKSLRQHQDEKKLQQLQQLQLQEKNDAVVVVKQRDPIKTAAAWSDPYSGPIRKHHLENQFGHGVDPEHVLGLSDEQEALAARAAQALNRQHFDIPIQQHPTPDYILTAYLEPSNIDSDWHVLPLPRRETSTAKRQLLQKRTYSRLHSCSKLTQQWPTDDIGDGGDAPTVDDAFLPWIHDVFPTADGAYIQVVAQNKRRCKTGRHEQDIMMFQQPQAALFQHVPVKRVKNVSSTADGDNKNSTTTRYQLTTHDQADPDGIATRYICRFKSPNYMKPHETIETLSEFNFDYDWTNYRKRYRGFLKEDGGIKAIHSSQLVFKCPVPEQLQDDIRTGAAVRNDWATIFLDIVPIRTPPRYGQPLQFLQPRYKSFETTNVSQRFDPIKAWGDDYIIPLIEDSGRWENIPICKPSLLQYENQTAADLPAIPQPRQVKHRLVSCIWASAGYATRGNRFAINDGQRRLMEWLSHNIAIGFDHFYLYDNSGAFRNDTSLKPVVDLFPDHVTYVPWPSQICNNNPNNVDSVGERSSQYAAESSCRLRFGPHVDWIGQFDIDEYLIPMGNYTNALQLLDKLEQEDTRIISLKSWRAWPRWDYIQHPVEKINDKSVCWHTDPCFSLKIPLSTTMLQAYNCDRQPPGQKKDKMPAEKQIYRADYVTSHFVHYAAVTALSEMNETEYVKQGFRWKSRAFPDPRQRFGDENQEALMVHTKAVAVQDTAGWERACHVDHLKLPRDQQETCRLGMPWPEPWPDNPATAKVKGTPEGKAYNCYVNNKVETILVPKLEREMAKRTPFFQNKIYPASTS